MVLRAMFLVLEHRWRYDTEKSYFLSIICLIFFFKQEKKKTLYFVQTQKKTKKNITHKKINVEKKKTQSHMVFL